MEVVYNMGKIFLSHSSKDKSYVNEIAEYFGKDRCVYDSMCFEAGMKNLDEIFKGIESTSLFVWFISKNSLESDWVKRELYEAKNNLLNDESKLSQIFPIIIDPSIQYDDDRIPDIFKKGFESYNLRYIKSNKIACKKIKTQYIKGLLDHDLSYKKKYFVYYGRNREITLFKNTFDGGQKIKCIVVSGIEGIGRRSYIIKTLRDTEILPEYYEPSVISMDKDDMIDDMILKLTELGFAEYTLDQVVLLSSMDEKIKVLTEILQEIQKQKEHVIIYDDLSLVDFSGEVKYWFTKALLSIRSEVTVSIASKVKLNFTYTRTHNEYISIELSSLTYPEWNGLLRVYSQNIGIFFDSNDRSYFKDIITGYPPQVINCADIAKEKGVEYVKNHANELIKNISNKITEILEIAFTEQNKQLGYELLAFLSRYGTMPMQVLYDIIKLDSQYQEVLTRLKALTICRLVGSSNDYIEVSPVIADYIQRNNFKTSKKINEYLGKQIEEFNKNITNPNITDLEDFETIKFYLKENLKNGKEVPEKFLYSTLYLKSVRELYDKTSYKKVIEIMTALKQNGSFDRFDLPIQERLQGYYCRALARETNEQFYIEVEWYKNQGHFNKKEYYFLRGFMFRHMGEFKKAIERYSSILREDPKHRGALREIVAAYRGLEDYESYRDYAKYNYQHDPTNPYQIQPYFESIIQKTEKSSEEKEDIDEILVTITKINMNNPLVSYYEIKALYAMYITKSKEEAIQFIKEGKREFPESTYILKTEFDCYEKYSDIAGMMKSIKELEKYSKNNRSAIISLKRRQILLDAHLKKSEEIIFLQIEALKELTNEAKENLKKRVKLIINR